MSSEMSQKEAMILVLYGAYKYVDILEKQRVQGPEGVKNINALIEELNKAIRLVGENHDRNDYR